jgi:diguanylate cyclase (GGDEF)-like protein/PAS domain S-box-containing protein
MVANIVANFAVVGVFAALWINAQDWLIAQKPRTASILLGLVMGAAALVCVLSSYRVDGFMIDLRAVPVALAAVFGGPISAAIATIVVVAGRLIAGGPGALAAATAAVLVGLAGIAGWYLIGRGVNRMLLLVAVAIVTGARSFGVYPLLSPAMQQSFFAEMVPAMLPNTIGVLVLGAAMFHARDRAAERTLMLGAIQQAPDYFYVKDTRLRFIAANQRVADAHGLERPADLKGLTDRDLETPERAAELGAAEVSMIMSGRPVSDLAETIRFKDGQERAFVTSKVPVYSGSGEMVGLVGVSKDVTRDRELQQELGDSRDRLALVLAEMSDGVALIDKSGHFVLTNEQYRNLFPRTGHLRVAGAFLPSVLQAVVDTGEQPAVTSANGREYIADSMASMRDGGDRILHMFDGRWLQKRVRVNAQGIAVAVVSDITSIKLAEMDLLAVSKQLEVLSITDGLTQLTNRRGFDDAIKREFARARRTDQPISVILLDIDRFKAFNDRYGHIEGDEALRRVSAALTRALKRPGDLAARYGGEEMAVILPDTTLQGAYQVAEAIRSAIRDLRLEHEASEKGIVTASFGVASADPLDPRMSERQLLVHADEALYLAKGSGRDRVVAWSDPRLDYPVVPYRPVA